MQITIQWNNCQQNGHKFHDYDDDLIFEIELERNRRSTDGHPKDYLQPQERAQASEVQVSDQVV